MHFIGGQEHHPAEGDHRLIAAMFARLPGAVPPPAGGLSRLAGYEAAFGPGAGGVRFFGMETTAAMPVPAGLTAWDFDGAEWTVRCADDAGRETVVWRERVAWQWGGRPGCPGEFCAAGAPEWRGAGAGAPVLFSMFANVPFDASKPGFCDEVRLADPDPSWPDQYARLAAELRARLGADIALRMEHYGSTAIPGIPAKPVIDILVEVPSLDAARQRALTALAGPEWEYWLYSGHLVFFKRRGVMGERVCHVHLAPAGHDVWKGLGFRDYLRSHPAVAARYADLKRRLAAANRTDRERYTELKGAFVAEINRLAAG